MKLMYIGIAMVVMFIVIPFIDVEYIPSGVSVDLGFTIMRGYSNLILVIVLPFAMFMLGYGMAKEDKIEDKKIV